MSSDPRVMAYTAAAIQGMLAAEHPDIQLSSIYVAQRAHEITTCTILLQAGCDLPSEDEIIYCHSPSPAPAAPVEDDDNEDDDDDDISSCHIHVAHTVVDYVTPSDPDLPLKGDPTALQSVWKPSNETETEIE